ncbi:hypothetical protein [Picosynechococcus sp. NKBG042902]|uniref:hypothetical protein n=1 Tax=Picosynechococcus sp. NKBG042902 TaxID=490193 RepID=UPI0004AB2E01|nr:hypothetical protein [Picosynechococcus sp. NKBG042902]
MGDLGGSNGTAWWDDVRPRIYNRVTAEAPKVEAYLMGNYQIDWQGNADPRNAQTRTYAKPAGIDLELSMYGYALNEFSKHPQVLDSSGIPITPEEAFAVASDAVTTYRLSKLTGDNDFSYLDPLTQWYLLAWDIFQAREFPYDEARKLAIAVGGFDVNDLKGQHKLITAKSGKCDLLKPAQRLKKRAFTVSANEFALTSLIDGLHAVIAIYQEEKAIEPVRQFLKKTELLANDQFMKAWEVALKAIPHIRDEKKRLPEEKALADLWLAMDEINAKVRYVTPEDAEGTGQAVQTELDLSP